MLKRTTNTIILSFCFYMLFVVLSPLYAEEKSKQEPPPKPVTISDPAIPVDELLGFSVCKYTNCCKSAQAEGLRE